MNTLASRLDAAVRAVAPITGVFIGNPDDKATWGARFVDGATKEQQDAAIAIIAAFNPDEPAALAPLTPRQLRLMMLSLGLTDAHVQAQIDAIADETDRAAALIEWNWATYYERDHWLVVLLAAALGFEPVELDALWIYAATI